MIVFFGLFHHLGGFSLFWVALPTKISAGLHDYNCMPNSKGVRVQRNFIKKNDAI